MVEHELFIRKISFKSEYKAQRLKQSLIEKELMIN